MPIVGEPDPGRSLREALARTSGAILRARERDPLLWDVCRICVEEGAARLAYVALVDGAVARPVAWAGASEAFLRDLVIPLDPAHAEGRGPIATAILAGEPYVANDLFADAATTPWHDRARTLGSQATAAFPLRDGGRVVGALSLHADRPGYFDDAVIGVLAGVAEDLSFALHNIERETARAHAMRQAEAGYERFQKIFHASPVATAISTLDDGRLLAVNDAFCALIGHSRETLISRSVRDLGVWPPGSDRDDLLASLARDGRVREMPARMRVASGELRDVEISAELFDFAGERCILKILNDVTERRRFESRIEFLATHDGLTELPNRTVMMDRVAQALQHARRTGTRVAVLYIDLDRFKVVNEALGQKGGDEVLVEIAARLRRVMREGDTVARFSGDEFVALVPDLERLSDCYTLVQRVLAALFAPLDVAGRTLHVLASVGISVFPADGDGVETLLRNAEAAMQRAKGGGPGGAQFYTAEMSAELRRLAELEARLSGALAAGQLRLVYQPKVELARGTIAGVEALLRWEHPDLGVVPPATFIPVAEEAGTIVPIGAWVLRTACAQNMAWQAAGLPALPISVNVSAAQFVQPDLVAAVADTLHATGMPGHLLELEITETVVARNAGRMMDIMSLLRELGVRFSIDDFGTGYSNLGYLKRFQLDRLKIDQSFVRNVDTDPGDAAIARAVISLARSLQLEVTAEGVENAAQCDFMRLHTCDEIQGFYFSQPVGADALAHMLREGRRLH
jgi:diguanylate cyclase (GGDEF)-like protein/PAS domain S-box-containing protein